MPKFDKVEPVSADTKPTSALSCTVPKITITYCTQCRWLLRAAYFAQELLSTFETALGEVSLRPTTGGIFQVTLDYTPSNPSVATPAFYPAGSVVESRAGSAEDIDKATEPQTRRILLWDRKAEGGFPETKILKQRVRDVVQPGRGLGHSDGHKKQEDTATQEVSVTSSVQDTNMAHGVAANKGADGEVGLKELGEAVQQQKQGKDNCETCP
ncbi:hypothetical protein FH972_025960 [Carpinus fangiana]|uniref:Uncharacterized protein n=1 Tax=Carpinus fangiana TaxID=176857 RepID=A0A5N6L2J2_9ROSI|nr:hypothetical protein FH972_025960 [Carpinus fangiana]